MVENNISFYNVIKSLSSAMDLISEEVVGHHKKVAYIAYKIGEEMNLSRTDLIDLILAAFIHDIGVFSMNQTFADLSFDRRDNRHAEVGYHLLEGIECFENITDIIRFHHVEWKYGKGKKNKGKEVPHLAHILHLADRIAVVIKKKTHILEQVDEIKNIINTSSGRRFWPDAVEKFNDIADREYFWLDLISSSTIERRLDSFSKLFDLVTLEELYELSHLFSHIIDFRSPFTATHSSGVSSVSKKISEYMKFKQEDIMLMEIAGYFHDIGKLAVPVSILDKKGKLTVKEMMIIKTHTYHTFQILDIIKIDNIKEWASYHHERLNGKGYPFHMEEKDLTTGARIMAVADIFTAITEDRPYRKGMNREKSLGVLNKMSNDKLIDKEIVSVVNSNYYELNLVRKDSQIKAEDYYNSFKEEIEVWKKEAE